VHLYKFVSARHYIVLAVIVKVHIGSPKTARNEQVCTQQVILEVNSAKYLWGCCASEGL